MDSLRRFWRIPMITVSKSSYDEHKSLLLFIRAKKKRGYDEVVLTPDLDTSAYFRPVQDKSGVYALCNLKDEELYYIHLDKESCTNIESVEKAEIPY